MIEMELKACIRNKKDIKNKLKKFKCEWIDEGEQIDMIYVNDIKNEISSPIFRIRKSKNGCYLTLKVLEKNINTANEIETRIIDEKAFVEMLQLLGFHLCATVKKHREITIFKGFNICLDEVEQLGAFIEIEKLSEDNQGQNEVYYQQKKILSLLGIEENMITNEKYYQMILSK